MSHYGSPPDPHRAEPDRPYNPYPANWDQTSQSSPASPYGDPTPYAPQSPEDQQSLYGQQPGPPVNPYAGSAARTDRPTFGFGGYASWLARVGAFIIDYVLYLVSGAPLWVGEFLQISGTTTDTQGNKTVTSDATPVSIGLIVLGGLTVLAFFIWNVCIRQGRTGATVGKSVLAIRLVNSDLQPIGPGWSFLRYILHIVDALPCYLGYLWPIWDSRKQTFADKIMTTFVIHATEEAPRAY